MKKSMPIIIGLLILLIGFVFIPSDEIQAEQLIDTPIRVTDDYSVISDIEVIKANQFSSAVTEASQNEVTVESAEGFRVGQFVFLKESDTKFEVGEIANIIDTTLVFQESLEHLYGVGTYITTYYPTFYVTGDNVTFRNVRVDGNKANQEDTRGVPNGPDDDWGEIHLVDADHCRLTDVSVEKSQFNGLNVISSDNVIVERGQYNNCWANGVNFHQGNYRCLATGVMAENNADDGFEADNGSTMTIFSHCMSWNNGDRSFKAISGRAVFIGCESKGGVLGIEAFGEGHTITGNLIENPNDFGIYLHNANAVVVTGNTIIDADTGIYMSGNNDNIILGNNVFQNCLRNIVGFEEPQQPEQKPLFIPAQSGCTSGNATMGGYGPIHEIVAEQYSSFYLNTTGVTEVFVVLWPIGNGSFEWLAQIQAGIEGEIFWRTINSSVGSCNGQNRILQKVDISDVFIGADGYIGGKFWCTSLDGIQALRVIGFEVTY